MVVTDTMLMQWITAFLLPFFRVAAFVVIAPVFSVGAIPMKIKLILSLALTVAIAPGITGTTAESFLNSNIISVIFNQIVIGISLGLVCQLIFSAIINGGQIIGMQMGLGFAQMMDPQTGVSVPVIAQFYNILAILLFMSINGHLAILGVLSNSFDLIPVTGSLLTEKYLSIAMFGVWIFAGGIMIALPAVTALLAINIVLGVVTRAAPQMNIFAIGFVITIMAGFVIMLLTLPITISQMITMFDQSTEMMMSLMSEQ